MNRQLPAFAKPIAAARRRGMTLRNPAVSVRLHWGRRPTLGYGVIVPDDSNPGDLDWGWVRGLEVLVFKDGDAPDRVAQAVAAIQPCRPRRLLVVDFIDSKIICFVTLQESQDVTA